MNCSFAQATVSGPKLICLSPRSPKKKHLSALEISPANSCSVEFQSKGFSYSAARPNRHCVFGQREKCQCDVQDLGGPTRPLSAVGITQKTPSQAAQMTSAEVANSKRLFGAECSIVAHHFRREPLSLEQTRNKNACCSRVAPEMTRRRESGAVLRTPDSDVRKWTFHSLR